MYKDIIKQKVFYLFSINKSILAINLLFGISKTTLYTWKKEYDNNSAKLEKITVDDYDYFIEKNINLNINKLIEFLIQIDDMKLISILLKRLKKDNKYKDFNKICKYFIKDPVIRKQYFKQIEKNKTELILYDLNYIDNSYQALIIMDAHIAFNNYNIALEVGSKFLYSASILAKIFTIYINLGLFEEATSLAQKNLKKLNIRLLYIDFLIDCGEYEKALYYCDDYLTKKEIKSKYDYIKTLSDKRIKLSNN